MAREARPTPAVRPVRAMARQRSARTLVVGASSTLEQLSSGQYALGGRRPQRVRSHRSPQRRRTPAGEDAVGRRDVPGVARARVGARRPGRRQWRRQGAAKLDSIFLDEGFGTPRPRLPRHRRRNTRDPRSDDRVVGIVTHVRDLAERVPVAIRSDEGAADVDRHPGRRLTR